jgi:hypothetical protein
MDYDWTPVSTRPQKLYRVYRPLQYTILSPRGLTASNTTLYLPSATHSSIFIQTLTDHRTQASRPTPYISFFASKTEAEMWAVAAEDEFHKPGYVLEVDVRHKTMEGSVMWKVEDVQRKSGKQLGLGGTRNSEWVVLYRVPGQAISRTFRSSTQIRIGKYPSLADIFYCEERELG